MMLQEWHYSFENTRRWRNLRKITIASVHGPVFADVVGARLGMVSKIFPRVALLIKESVNQSGDNMGFYYALNACFTLHELNHSHWAQIHDSTMPAAEPADGVPSWRDAPPVVPARKDMARAPDPS